LSDPGFVSVAVYDLLGRKLTTLVDEMKYPGNFTVTWDAGGLTSGVYFCRMTVQGIGDNRSAFTEVKKMMLVK